ncbi:MAG: CHAT domain-containing protein, partial [Gemmatimonadota bacterium]|nr:CHAT domain-containing protein [Gemmatimonadota bacterium]
LYGELLAPSAKADDIARYARLGRGQLRFHALLLTAANDDFTRVQADAQAAADSSAQALALLGAIHVRGRQQGGRGIAALLDSVQRLVPEQDTIARAEIACAAEQLERAPRASLALATAGRLAAAGASAPHIVVECQILRVASYARLVKLDSAALAFTDALALANVLRDSSLLATLYLIRGISSRIIGQSEFALSDLHRAMRAARSSADSSNIAFLGYHLGVLSLSFGDRYVAERYAKQASASFTRAGDYLGLAYMRSLEADLAMRHGDLAGARRLYLSGLRWADRQADLPVAVNMLAGLASVELKESQWDAALGHLDSAYALTKSYTSSATKPSFDHLRAYIARERGDLVRAERGFRAWIALIQPFQNELRHGARISLAEVLLARGDLRAAEEEMIAATADLDRYRATLSDDQMRLHAVDRSNELGGGNDEADAIIAASALAGHTRVAFELAERRRARTLLDKLLQADVIARGGSARAALRPSRRGDVATLDSLIAAMPDERTAIVEFVSVAGRPSAALVITKAGARAYPVAPIDSVRGMVGRFVTLLESGNAGGALAGRLGKALLAAPLSELPSSVDRLVIVPDDALQRLPWSAIVTSDGKALIERYAVSTVPSATVLMRLWRHRRESVGRGILAFGDPDVAAIPPAGVIQTSGDDRVSRAPARLPRLPGSAAEARSVSALAAHSVLRLGTEATESYLKRASLDSFAVVHFATHAFVDEQTATRTWLALAAGGGEDGFVGPTELAALSLHADLVVLSGCSTGRGVLVTGEGVQGLTTPLLEAGARAVLATQWEVTDRSARSLVERFYAALSRGLDVGDALRAAKREEASRGAPARDWAAFTLVGDPTVRPALDRAR